MERSLRYFLYKIKIYRNQGAGFGQLKHFKRWRAAMEPGANSVRDEQPWITFDAIDVLNKHVNAKSRVFEYGGGGSSLFFMNRGAQLVTVEHDQAWFEILSKQIAEKNKGKWQGQFIEKQTGSHANGSDPAHPDHYASADEASKGFYYENYVKAIDHFPDGSFDVVLVDGRSRTSCIKHSIAKLKTGGLLVLDNSDRTYYTTAFQDLLQKDFKTVIDHYGASPYTNDFTKTSIWKKNK